MKQSWRIPFRASPQTYLNRSRNIPLVLDRTRLALKRSKPPSPQASEFPTRKGIRDKIEKSTNQKINKSPKPTKVPRNHSDKTKLNPEEGGKPYVPCLAPDGPEIPPPAFSIILKMGMYTYDVTDSKCTTLTAATVPTLVPSPGTHNAGH